MPSPAAVTATASPTPAIPVRRTPAPVNTCRKSINVSRVVTPNESRWAASARNEAATVGVRAVARAPSARPRATATTVRRASSVWSGPSRRAANPAASTAASSEPAAATAVISADPASSPPTTARAPIAAAPPRAATAAPAVAASTFASTRCRRATTWGSAAERPASTNRLTPATASAAR